MHSGLAPSVAPTDSAAPAGRFFSWRDWCRVALLVALFLVVTGARLWMVRSYTTPLPFWDQWDAEGAALLKPWLDGQLRPASFFALHNEHRVVLSRLLAFLLFLGNGQWDAQTAMVCNALFCGVTAVAIAGVGARLLPASSAAGRDRLLVVAALAAATLFVFPFGWENTLSAFQSQFYFLLLFSLVAIWGLGGAAPGSRRWWLGFFGALLACLSMASGCFAAAAVLILETLRWMRTRPLASPSRAAVVNVAVCLAFVIAGWLSTTVVPHHAALKVESVPAFFRALGRYLAWPLIAHPLLSIPLQLPLVWLVVQYLRGERLFPSRTAAQRGTRARLRPLVLATGGGHGVCPRRTRSGAAFALPGLAGVRRARELFCAAALGDVRRALPAPVAIGFPLCRRRRRDGDLARLFGFGLAERTAVNTEH